MSGSVLSKTFKGILFENDLEFYREQDRLTEQIKYKLSEIVEFCYSYIYMECKDIHFVDQKQAELNNKERRESILQMNSMILSSEGDESTASSGNTE